MKSKRKKSSNAQSHPMWPKGEKHPVTGEPFEAGTIEAATDIIELKHGPPRMPTREIYDADDDGYLTFLGTRTDAEMELAVDEYNEAAKRYAMSGGVERYPGRVTIRGEFSTKSGAMVSGLYDGDDSGGQWTWLQWSVAE